MTIKKKSIFILVLLFITISILALPRTGFAVPAAPIVHTLIQQDGTTFQARQWGDEFVHGWETTEGYTVVFDQGLQCWTYAEHDILGRLVSTLKIVGKYPPPADFPRHLRPAGEFSLMSLRKRAPQELTHELISPIGTAKIPVFLINFNNTKTIYNTSNFKSLLFGTNNHTMNDYYKEVSYNVFSITGDVAGWYTASNTHDYYGQNYPPPNGNDRYPATLVTEAVAAADAANFDFTPYDNDGDCYVDVVAIVHEGTGEEASPDSYDIWSHSWDLFSAHYYDINDGNGIYTTKCLCSKGGNIMVNDYIIMPEKLDTGISTIGVFAHEYGHALGLPDLYDTDGTSSGIGRWSVMASGSWNGVARSGDRPAHMDAWCKYSLGWATPTQVSGTLANQPIKQAETYSDVYQLLSGSPLTKTGEYFLVENRQLSGFDAGLPGPGLLIWHIDESQDSNNYECYPGKPLCPLLHYHVALEQADNLWELEKKLSNGDAGDPYPGTTNNTSFTATSLPSSNLYNGSPSNVSVTDISASGSTMTATLSAITTCTYAISPASQSFASSGGSGSVTVTAPNECAWTATSNDSWITIDSGSSGYGNGIVQYSVSAHTATDSRTGTMTIAEKTFTVTEVGIVECSNWSDVIAKYNSYVSGQVSWSDVIDCYTKYTAQ